MSRELTNYVTLSWHFFPKQLAYITGYCSPCSSVKKCLAQRHCSHGGRKQGLVRVGLNLQPCDSNFPTHYSTTASNVQIKLIIYTHSTYHCPTCTFYPVYSFYLYILHLFCTILHLTICFSNYMKNSILLPSVYIEKQIAIHSQNIHNQGYKLTFFITSQNG